MSATIKLPVNAASRSFAEAEIDKVRDAVIPICGEDTMKRPRLLGSGVLVTFEGQPILLTARHVLSDNVDVPLFFFGADGESRPLHGRFEADEVNDLAAKLLSPEEARDLSHRPFLIEGAIARHGVGAGRFYAAVVGYPASGAKRPARGVLHTPMEAYFDYATELVGGTVLVHFDVADGAYSNTTGHGRPKSPTGKSGGAIFGFPAGANLATGWGPPKLVGISSRWKRRENRIEGAGVSAIVKILKKVAASNDRSDG